MRAGGEETAPRRGSLARNNMAQTTFITGEFIIQGMPKANQNSCKGFILKSTS
jgi:hypothetical protein